MFCIKNLEKVLCSLLLHIYVFQISSVKDCKNLVRAVCCVATFLLNIVRNAAIFVPQIQAVAFWDTGGTEPKNEYEHVYELYHWGGFLFCLAFFSVVVSLVFY